MKNCVFAITLICLPMFTQSVRADDAQSPVVLVQLFTSEGCSSCPPADALLAEFAKSRQVGGVTVVPMSMHVDYWENLGWHDPFSSRQFTDYQREYQSALGNQSIYTPQMVVDGRTEFVGSDRAAATKAIAAAAKEAKASIQIEAKSSGNNQAMVRIELKSNGALSDDQTYNVMLAMTEDDLATQVVRGENAGKKLQHSAVVRSLARCGTISASTSDAPISINVELDPGWKRERLHVIAYIQSQKDLQILGAATARPAASSN